MVCASVRYLEYNEELAHARAAAAQHAAAAERAAAQHAAAADARALAEERVAAAARADAERQARQALEAVRVEDAAVRAEASAADRARFEALGGADGANAHALLWRRAEAEIARRCAASDALRAEVERGRAEQLTSRRDAAAAQAEAAAEEAAAARAAAAALDESHAAAQAAKRAEAQAARLALWKQIQETRERAAAASAADAADERELQRAREAEEARLAALLPPTQRVPREVRLAASFAGRSAGALIAPGAPVLPALPPDLAEWSREVNAWATAHLPQRAARAVVALKERFLAARSEPEALAVERWAPLSPWPALLSQHLPLLLAQHCPRHKPCTYSWFCIATCAGTSARSAPDSRAGPPRCACLSPHSSTSRASAATARRTRARTSTKARPAVRPACPRAWVAAWAPTSSRSST